MTIPCLRFTTIVLAAILAGTSFGICVGFNPMEYSPTTYVEQQQHLLRSLNRLMVTLVVVATLVTMMSAVVQRNDKPVFAALLVAAACFIACIGISRFGNHPIQVGMLTWTSDALPADWTRSRDRWWSFHVMRTMAELIALCLIVWAGIRRTALPPGQDNVSP